MKRLLKVVLVAVAISSAAWGLGQYLARRMEGGKGIADADDFRLAALWGGREFDSTAAALRSGWARAVLGGIAIDLREANLHPAGADVVLEASMGGIALVVPPEWRVTVDQDLAGGTVEVRTADPDTLPETAPELRVKASARRGGILVGNGKEG